jgi:caa(3)-type oxidase subunit IV
MESSHSSNTRYLVVGAALIILTVLEVITVNLPVPTVPFLLLYGVLKVGLIALFFMHLKDDRRLFAGMFAIGAVGGVLMITAMILVLTSHLG